jgi:hypothetical protein
LKFSDIFVLVTWPVVVLLLGYDAFGIQLIARTLWPRSR